LAEGSNERTATLWKMLRDVKVVVPEGGGPRREGAACFLFSLIQPAISQHPTASRDLYLLIKSLLLCPGVGLAKHICSEDVCLILDSAMQCDSPITAWAASQVLVALARRPEKHMLLVSDQVLGCIFSLHDRTDDATDMQAAVQCNICLTFCLLLTVPGLDGPSKEKLLRVYGIANMLENFCGNHLPTVHSPGCESALFVHEIVVLCHAEVPAVISFGRWCLARISFNYPSDFVGSGGWEALFQAVAGSQPAARANDVLPEAYAHVTAIEVHSQPGPGPTMISYTTSSVGQKLRGLFGWPKLFANLSPNLVLVLKEPAGSQGGVMRESLQLTGNGTATQDCIRIHPEKKYENRSVLQLAGFDEQGQPSELLLALDTDEEMFHWLAAVRRAIARFQETGGAVAEDSEREQQLADPSAMELRAVESSGGAMEEGQMQEALRQSLADNVGALAANEGGAALAEAEDSALEAALQQSLADSTPAGDLPSAATPPAEQIVPVPAHAAADDANFEEQLALAMAASMQVQPGGEPSRAGAPQPAVRQAWNDALVEATQPALGFASGDRFATSERFATDERFATESSGQADTHDAGAVASLTGLGFDEAQARQALGATGGSLDRAADWLFSIPPPSGGVGTAPIGQQPVASTALPALRMLVTIPANATGGSQITVEAPDGRRAAVMLPNDVCPGDQIQVEIPAGRPPARA
jgi:hypothetical protein